MSDTEEISERRMNALDWCDSLPRETRECVYEFGDAIVHCCLDMGITKPGQIRQLVHEIWKGARSQGERAGTFQCGGRRTLNQLSWLLMQAGSEISAATLVRVLKQSGFVILPIEPSTEMVAASMETVTNHDVKVTKEQKHRLRLRAAIRAGMEQFWPHLVTR